MQKPTKQNHKLLHLYPAAPYPIPSSPSLSLCNPSFPMQKQAALISNDASPPPWLPSQVPCLAYRSCVPPLFLPLLCTVIPPPHLGGIIYVKTKKKANRQTKQGETLQTYVKIKSKTTCTTDAASPIKNTTGFFPFLVCQTAHPSNAFLRTKCKS